MIGREITFVNPSERVKHVKLRSHEAVSAQPAESVKALTHVVCELKACQVIHVRYNSCGSDSILSAAGRTVRNYFFSYDTVSFPHGAGHKHGM
jgi:hypothetical protein